ncbi:hypothetical protein SAMN05445060_2797 [Williamsia sterculiae]|uniref:Transmembrane Fragile-X-F protein n=1 Tax=Williamsia sterculiae TaxID=1344003 RepID=A0A1N7GHJ1_9NOCA|nr:hypothetical protein SAMN05445060_2797 [Williamsia sterculiae]
MDNKSSSPSGTGIIGVVLIVFIILKLVGVITWPWIWVLSPIWISFLIVIAAFVLFALIVLIVAIVRTLRGRG